MRYLVTGGAGFIGSHLVDALLDGGAEHVRIVDNFTSGRRSYVQRHAGDPRLEIVEADLLDRDGIDAAFEGRDIVFHLAANPDARWGIENTRLDLEQETIVTYNVLESMRRRGVGRIVFSSSGTVYGDIGTTFADETFGPCLPVSLYGSGKLACEGLVSGFCGTFGLAGIIYRFGNVIGERTTHGVIFDFIRKLRADPERLEVLGDGRQAKPYVYVRDLVAGLRHAETMAGALEPHAFDVFNIAPPDATSVRFIAQALVGAVGLSGRTAIAYGTTASGWVGDVAQSRMNAAKLSAAGFTLPRTSDDAVRHALERIVAWIRASPDEAGDLRLPDTALT